MEFDKDIFVLEIFEFKFRGRGRFLKESKFILVLNEFELKKRGRKFFLKDIIVEDSIDEVILLKGRGRFKKN